MHMKSFIKTLSILLLAMVAPVSAIAGNTSNKTVTVKKVPKNRKDSIEGVRVPSQAIFCVIDMETGIQPIDTSDVESYEVWDSNDATMIASFGDEFDFVAYVLGDHPQCIIKLRTPDYVYVGYLDQSLVQE